MTSTLFVFWLEDTCVPDDKISAAWWARAYGTLGPPARGKARGDYGTIRAD